MQKDHALISWESLSKSFGAKSLFRDLSGGVQRGEVVAVVGRNGSGKSTFLKILAGIVRPTAGRVERGDSVDGTGRELRHFIGLASPELHFYPELTASENLSFFSRFLGRPRDPGELARKLETLGFDAADIDKRVGTFSSGMLQRLRLAFARLVSPPVLLLDEPSANLDEMGREVVRSVLLEQRNVGATILATNDSREAALADWNLALG